MNTKECGETSKKVCISVNTQTDSSSFCDSEKSSATEAGKTKDGMRFLTELIESNPFKNDKATKHFSTSLPNRSVNAINPSESPNLQSKSKTAVVEKQNILSADVDKDEIIFIGKSQIQPVERDQANKKPRLLIGKNVAKVPELSVSTLERQLDSIITDAANHLKEQEEKESQVKQNQSIIYDLNTLNNKDNELVYLNATNNG